MENKKELKEPTRRKKREKYAERSTVNVSLQKRNYKLLNSILIEWEKEGYNISNEVCEAIIFKNRTNINPHICTILSTLSLIESSIRSQKISKHMTEEQIDSKTLEIFNEVITIDIDGNKLTNLLKGINIAPSMEVAASKEDIKTKNMYTQTAKPLNPIVEQDLEKEEIEMYQESFNMNAKDVAESNYTTNTPTNSIDKVDNDIKVKEDLNKKDDSTKENKGHIVWSNFPEETIGNKENVSNNIFASFTQQSDFAI